MGVGTYTGAMAGHSRGQRFGRRFRPYRRRAGGDRGHRKAARVRRGPATQGSKRPKPTSSVSATVTPPWIRGACRRWSLRSSATNPIWFWAARVPVSRGVWPPHARLGNLAVTRMLHRRTGVRLRDLGPMRAAKREALIGLGMTDRRSGYPLEMVVKAADNRWRIRETTVPYLPRAGRSKVTGTWRGTWHTVRDMRKVLRG